VNTESSVHVKTMMEWHSSLRGTDYKSESGPPESRDWQRLVGKRGGREKKM